MDPHQLTDKQILKQMYALVLGQELGPVPEQYMPDIEAYAQATSVLSKLFIEQFSVLDKYKIAGTPDRIVEYKGERFIADLKRFHFLIIKSLNSHL